MLSLSGYGRNGPRANYLAYGVTICSFLGLTSAWGYTHGTLTDYLDGGTGPWPRWPRWPRPDHGTPAFLDVAQIDAVAPMLAELYTPALNRARPRPQPNRSPGSWLSGVFPCRGMTSGWPSTSRTDRTGRRFAVCSVAPTCRRRSVTTRVRSSHRWRKRWANGCRGAAHTPPCTICSWLGSLPGWSRTWRTSGGIHNSGPGGSWTPCGSRISDMSPTRGPPSVGASRRGEPRCRRRVSVSTRGTSFGGGSGYETTSRSWEEGGAIFSAD